VSGDDREAFERAKAEQIEALGRRADLTELSNRWIEEVSRLKYSYHFTWLGLPVIQFPQDVVAMQELVWRVKPDLVVETGVARGGSLVLYASLLELIGGPGRVLGVDIEIRPHNRAAIEGHPMAGRIELLEGSSTDPAVVERVAAAAGAAARVLVVLDSMHTHEHVLAELRAYAPLVTAGSYCVVFDTIIEDLPADYFPDRPWGPGNSPRSAVDAFLAEDDRFRRDASLDAKLQITVGRGGWLERVK